MGTDVRQVIALALALSGLTLGGCKDTGEGEPAGGPWVQLPATPAVATPGAVAGGAGGAGGAAGMAGAGGMGGAAGMAGAGASGGMAEATIAGFDTGTVTGTATFTQSGTDVTLVVTLMNCPDGMHGVHIHEGTSCADATMQGAHWGGNGPPATRGEGIPNVMCTGMTGTAMVTRTAADPMLAWTIGGDAATNVVGHAFVVHNPAPATPADAPAPRIGCGVIMMK